MLLSFQVHSLIHHINILTTFTPTGEGVNQLSIDERLAIANMTTEWGTLAGTSFRYNTKEKEKERKRDREEREGETEREKERVRERERERVREREIELY